MTTKTFRAILSVLALAALLVTSCVSQRTGAVCSEKQWRYDHLDQSDPQKEWLKAEIDECDSLYAVQKGADSVRFQGIRERYQLQFSDSADTVRNNSPSDSAASEPAADTSGVR